jgi:hypothetical protein
MRSLSFAGVRGGSALFLAVLTGLPALACGESSPNSDNGSPNGGSAAQAGSAGTSVAGASMAGTSAAGTATGGSGTAAGGSGSSTSGTGTGGAMSGGSAGSASGGAAGSAGATSGGSGGSATALDKFSFFVTSMAAMQRLAKSQDGFGGDLRYGTDDGLLGADKICTEIAESSMPGASAKQWHAFLSTKKGPVHAKDRIGQGPWYDRTGRLVAMNLTDLLQARPKADAAIKEDLPNEFGIGNHRPNPNAPEDDNHHTLTGSGPDGTLYTAEGNMATCLDWTSKSRDNSYTAEGTGRPRIGFSWSTAGRTHWISGQTEGGCGAGVTGVGEENGGSDPGNPIVGSGGGYGGIYCFALVP